MRRGGRSGADPREPQASAGARPLDWGGPATLRDVRHAVRIWGDGTETRETIPAGPRLRPVSLESLSSAKFSSSQRPRPRVWELGTARTPLPRGGPGRPAPSAFAGPRLPPAPDAQLQPRPGPGGRQEKTLGGGQMNEDLALALRPGRASTAGSGGSACLPTRLGRGRPSAHLVPAPSP